VTRIAARTIEGLVTEQLKRLWQSPKDLLAIIGA